MVESSAGTCVDDGTVGTLAWTSPANSQNSDNVYATARQDSGVVSHYLKCTGFGFSVPADATILGITVEWERFTQVATNGNQDSAVRIVKGGTVDTTVNRAVAGAWSTTQAFYPYGGPTDLWGIGWTASDINASGFGAALSVQFLGGGGMSTASVDSLRITVTYRM